MAHPVEEGSGAPSFRPLWTLMPYLWPKGRPDLKARVAFSIIFLVLSTVATAISPRFFGWAVDAFGKSAPALVLTTVLSLIGAYALSRILLQAFAQLRDGVFAQVQYHAMR